VKEEGNTQLRPTQVEHFAAVYLLKAIAHLPNVQQR
jgi:hypothetical protein